MRIVIPLQRPQRLQRNRGSTQSNRETEGNRDNHNGEGAIRTQEALLAAAGGHGGMTSGTNKPLENAPAVCFVSLVIPSAMSRFAGRRAALVARATC